MLLVDDDLQLCGMLAEYLQRDGFFVTSVHDGKAGVDAVTRGGFDVVVMDITMPVMDGFEALRRIRSASEVPVVMLTARGDEVDRIVGLEIGADDYLPKPFNPRELAARLRAVLRRVHTTSLPQMMTRVRSNTATSGSNPDRADSGKKENPSQSPRLNM